MEETPPSGLITRRNFVKSSAATLAWCFLQGCSTTKSSLSGSAGRSPQGNQHPLSFLSFPKESVVSSAMNLQQVDTPVRVSEGFENWHQKGVHPYAYRITGESADLSWEKTPQLLRTPPVGLRSGISLGNVGTGTIEFLADGRLNNWQIFNNSPGEGNKVHVDDAFFAIRTSINEGSPTAITLRTQPPDSLPAANSLGYAGSYPGARLRLIDNRIPISVQLYAYGLPAINNVTQLNVPAVVFSFLLTNPTREAVSTAVMFNLPNVLEGTFRTERGLILSKSGETSSAGEICVGLASQLPASSMVSTDLKEVWKSFTSRTGFQSSSSLGLFDYGALASEFVLEPGATRTLSFVLSWRLPNRKIATQTVGNAYTGRFESASQINEQVVQQLPDTWQSLISWDTFLADNTLPEAVQRGLRASLNQLFKTTFCTSDGSWRSWDAFSDADLSSIDLMLYRVIPMLLLNPDMVKSVLRGYAATQQADGRIAGTLGRGSQQLIDTPPSPDDINSNSIFFTLAYVYQLYSGDKNFTKELWPHLLKALEWQLTITSPEGTPSPLPAQSDWLAPSGSSADLKDISLHLVGLEAMYRLANGIDRKEDAVAISPVIRAGIQTFRNIQSSPDVLTTIQNGRSVAKSRDLLIGLVWGHVLGFHHLFDASATAQLLEQISDENTPAIRLAKRKNNTRNDAPLWPAMAMNWATCAIQAGLSTSRSLDVVENLFQHMHQELADVWGHYEALSTESGLPLSTPNHASHLAVWLVLMSLSGQFYDATEGVLRLTPRISSGGKLPFFTPASRGILTAQKSGRYTIQIISGRLEVNRLEIGEDIVYRDMLIEQGQVVQLNP